MQILNNISFDNIKGDLFGGLTAAIVSLPLALAFGVASGVGPVAGLYGAVLVGLFAALFGGTSTLISEPTGPMTVVMTAVLTSLIGANPDNGLAMAFTVVMIAGVFQITLGLLKLGKYITLMPYSVISGFMSGIGVILILLQLAPFMGQSTPPGGVSATLFSLPELWKNIQPVETLLGCLTLAILFLFPKKWASYLPPQLLALVVLTAISLWFFTDVDIRRIGEIPLGLPSLVMPTFTSEQVTSMVLDGIVLGTLGCIDSLLTAVISDSLTRQEHKSDKELVGQGVGNLVSGLFGGLPGAGATMGTVVNIQSGAKTALSGIVRALILLIVILGAAKLTENIPLAVLAGIAIKVGLNILDWSFVKRAHKVNWQAAGIMYGVMLLTIFVDLIVAVGLGVFIANIITIEQLSALQSKNVKSISDSDDRISLNDDEKALLKKSNDQILMMYLSGPMIFGVSKAIAREHRAISRYQSVLIDLSDVPHMDTTVSLAIENVIKEAVELNKNVFMVKPGKQAFETLQKLNVFDLMPIAHVKESRIEALRLALKELNKTA